MALGRSIAAIIVAGIVIFVISQIVSILSAMVFPYNVLELGGMRSLNDPVMLLFFLYSWVLAFGLTFGYVAFQKAVPGKNKGLLYGFTTWLIAGLPSFFIVFSSMNYPVGFLVSNLVGSFLYFIAAGLVIAKIVK